VVQSDHDFLRNQPDTATPTPAPPDETDAPRAVPVNPEGPDQAEPAPAPEVAQPAPPPYEGQSVPPQYADFFRRTPYENAPPEVQRNTVQQAQARLARQGFYQGVADGELSNSFSRAVAAYQRDDDLRPTGRLDMDTLDDLNLLPRRHIFIAPPAPFGPVYRGIWVH
jgi:hypothetical protein